MQNSTIIDLFPAETSSDGVRVFRPFSETWAGQLTKLALEHPCEAGNCLALLLTGAALVYYVREVLKS